MKRIKINSGRTLKPSILAVVLFTVATVSYGQMRLQKPEFLKNIKERIAMIGQNEDLFKTVVYYEACENTMSSNIARTIHVRNLDVKYDERLEVEEWMTSSFETNIEEAIEIEDWMTSSFDLPLEEGVPVEDWMTSSFEVDVEPALNVESWMTAPFVSSELEASQQLEPWMSEPQTWLN